MSDSHPTTDRHSPGPWQVKPVGSLAFRRPGEDGAKDVYIVAADGICPGIVWDYLKEGEANARLIAAAPEMYAICRDMLDWVHGKREGRAVTDALTSRLVAAIDKAEGRS